MDALDSASHRWLHRELHRWLHVNFRSEKCIFVTQKNIRCEKCTSAGMFAKYCKCCMAAAHQFCVSVSFSMTDLGQKRSQIRAQASPNQTANLSGSVLGCIEARCRSDVLILQQYVFKIRFYKQIAHFSNFCTAPEQYSLSNLEGEIKTSQQSW